MEVHKVHTCPQSSIAMNADEAAPCDDKMTFVWLQTFQSLVGGFTEVVTIQAAKFCKWYLVFSIASVFRPIKLIQHEIFGNRTIAPTVHKS